MIETVHQNRLHGGLAIKIYDLTIKSLGEVSVSNVILRVVAEGTEYMAF